MPLDDDGNHDLDAMAREITAATRLVLVCNPNNPTATALPPEQIAEFVAGVPDHVAVILDEAYVEFNLLQDPDESVELLARHSNLILLRTFSKIYGLCGLRVGYALGPERFRRAIDHVRQPFSVNALAQAAAVEALRHQDEIARRIEATVIERVHMESELDARGLDALREPGQLLLDLARRARRGRHRRRPGRAGRDRARRQRARRGGPPAGDLRHARRERPLPGGAGPAA